MNKVQFVQFAVNFVVILGNIITYAIIARILMSWFTMGRPGSGGRIAMVLREVTEPFISLARKIPHKIGMFDLAPIIAVIGVDLIAGFIVYLLINFA